MYRLILYNVIINIAVAYFAIINCLKGEKRTKESKKTLKTTPINYETDPAVLERERRQKIAENREKMRRKRQKPIRRPGLVEDSFKEAVMTTKKVKEKEMLSEDSTQPTYSDESLEATSSQKVMTARAAKFENVEKAQKKQTPKKPVQDERKAPTVTSSSEEEIGEVQLVDPDPYAAAKKHIIKKRAQELARKKQFEENARKRQERENVNYDTSPDDTLKNISSIQFESQLSIIQRKRGLNKTTKSSDESQDGTIIGEQKSNELYIRDMPERVVE